MLKHIKHIKTSIDSNVGVYELDRDDYIGVVHYARFTRTPNRVRVEIYDQDGKHLADNSYGIDFIKTLSEFLH